MSILSYDPALMIPLHLKLLTQSSIFSSERTAAEAKKLQEIRKELHKLESELAADVSVLRKQIEDASVKYMNAE